MSLVGSGEWEYDAPPPDHSTNLDSLIPQGIISRGCMFTWTQIKRTFSKPRCLPHHHKGNS